MMSRLKLFAVSALMLAAPSIARAQRVPLDPERAAIREVIVAMAASIQGARWASVDSLFAARGVHVLADTAGLRSWAAYRDSRLKPELAHYGSPRVSHTGVEAQVRGNVAWVAFRQEIGGTTPVGPPPTVGRGSAVLEKVNGGWVIVQLHISR